jgi:hypothetical protein
MNTSGSPDTLQTSTKFSVMSEIWVNQFPINTLSFCLYQSQCSVATPKLSCIDVLVHTRNPHRNVWSFVPESTVGNWSIFCEQYGFSNLYREGKLQLVGYFLTTVPTFYQPTKVISKRTKIAKLRPTILGKSSKTHHDGREDRRR